MTSREIIKANLEHTFSERPGLSFKESDGLISDIVWGGASPSGYVQRRWTDNNIEYYDDCWGNIWGRMLYGCNAGEVVKPAIEDWSQLVSFETPHYDLEDGIASNRRMFSSMPDKFKLTGISGWIFATARYIRKMENYLLDLALHPEELNILHRKLAEVFKIQIIAAGEAGADGIFFYEDMGTQSGLLMSPVMWQEYFGEIYSGLFSIAHEYGMKVFMHSCGKNDQVLASLLECGVNCFQFDQPTIYEFEWLQSLLKKYQAALWSPIDIQKILPTGDKQIICDGVDAMFKAFKGNLIFGQYGDLPGIGVKAEWNKWAYDRIFENIRSQSSGIRSFKSSHAAAPVIDPALRIIGTGKYVEREVKSSIVGIL